MAAETVNLESAPRAATLITTLLWFGATSFISWKIPDAGPETKNAYFKLKFSMDDWSYTIEPQEPFIILKSYSWTGEILPLELIRKIPNSKTGSVRVTLETYERENGVDQYVGSDEKVSEATIPEIDEVMPSINTMSLTVVNSDVGDLADLYLQGISKVKVELEGTGKYDATITSKIFTVDGRSYSIDTANTSVTSDIILGYGPMDVKLTVEDSRGFSTSKTLTINVIPYSKPRVVVATGEENIVCYRCDKDGIASEVGNSLRVKAKRSYSPCVVEGVQRNFCALRLRYRASTDKEFSKNIFLLPTESITDEVDKIVLENLSAQKSYVVIIDAVDSLSYNTYVRFDIATEEVYLHKAGSKGSLGIGEYVEDDNTVSISAEKTVLVRGNLNGVRLWTKNVTSNTLEIVTQFDSFTEVDTARQTFFVFGEANGTLVSGVARVSNAGTTLWAGTSGVSLSTQPGGVLVVTLPNTANDIFTIFSAGDFSV
jgi:hypothetical protein